MYIFLANTVIINEIACGMARDNNVYFLPNLFEHLAYAKQVIILATEGMRVKYEHSSKVNLYSWSSEIKIGMDGEGQANSIPQLIALTPAVTK